MERMNRIGCTLAGLTGLLLIPEWAERAERAEREPGESGTAVGPREREAAPPAGEAGERNRGADCRWGKSK